jgi:uncharacterized membrane protein
MTMPTDTATKTITIDVPLDQVLKTIRAVETQPAWVKEILEADVLEEYEDGMPATARFKAATPVGSDRYTLEYEHCDDGMSWHLLEGRLQTGQDASYELRPLGPNRTEVTFRLTVSHNLPLPGFIRGRVINGLASSTVCGLKDYLERG